MDESIHVADARPLETENKLCGAPLRTSPESDDLDCFIPIEARPDVVQKLAKAIWAKVVKP